MGLDPITFPLGPFTAFYTEVLGKNSSDTGFQSLAQYLKANVPANSPIESVCFSNMYFNPWAALSPLSQEIGNESECSSTPLFLSFREFVLKRVQKIANINVNRKFDPEHINISYITRIGHLRYIDNEKEMLKEIEKQVCTGFLKRCKVSINLYNFSKLSYWEQFQVALDSDIFIGMHGAALTMGLYLQPYAHLIEISHPSRYGNFHFRNIAKFVNVAYHLTDGNDNLTEDHIKSIVNIVKECLKTLMDGVEK